MDTRHLTITSIGSDVIRIALAGDIDLASAAEIEDRIGPLADAGAHLEVDLQAITFIDTHGAAPLAAAARKAGSAGKEMAVVGWSPAAALLRDALCRTQSTAPTAGHRWGAAESDEPR